MDSVKRKFIVTFNDFLHYLFENVSEGYGKCYFKLSNGEEYQGWITEIFEETFEYFDSGPLARENAYILKIDDIDTNTFAYWDEEINKWTDYFVPDRIINRERTNK